MEYCDACGREDVRLAPVSDGTDLGETDYLCNECRGISTEEECENLALMIRRLIPHHPNDRLRQQARDLVRRYGFWPSITRSS